MTQICQLTQLLINQVAYQRSAGVAPTAEAFLFFVVVVVVLVFRLLPFKTSTAGWKWQSRQGGVQVIDVCAGNVLASVSASWCVAALAISLGACTSDGAVEVCWDK